MTAAPMPKAEFLTEDEYDDKYGPIMGPEDSTIWEYKDVKTKPTEHVWSVVEVEGDLYVIPGWHVVNMVGYNVTEQPWEHDNIEVRLDSIPMD
jgi:hypothetical protein